MARIGVIGVGSIGSVLAHGFDDLGHDVRINDVADDRVAALPYDGMDADALGAWADVLVLAVPTPTTERGGDASAVASVLETVTPTDATVVCRSTMPPGETGRLADAYGHPLVYSPEFLRDRSGVEDFHHPDRIVLAGPADERAVVREVLDPIECETVIETEDYLSAEIAKEAHNAFFATKVSFANQMRTIAETTGADPQFVMDVVTADSRNTSSHLDPMLGPYGGKCLVKGTRVATPEGYENIEELGIGSLVLDEEGVTEVTGKQERAVGSVVKVNARGREVVGSTDHIHLVWDEQAGEVRETTLSEVTEDDWVIIPDTVNDAGDRVILGEPPNGYIQWWPNHVEITPDLGWAIGLYLAEGCCSKADKHAIHWSLGGHEGELADYLCTILEDAGLNPYKRKQVSDGTYGESSCWIVRVRSQGLYKLFQRLGLGTNAHDKACPAFSGEVARRVVGGWLDGDGHHTEGTLSGYSRSTGLIRSIDRMLLDQGVCASIDSDGERLRISTKEEVEKVIDWSMTYEFDPDRYVDETNYSSPTLKRIENGWAAKVRDVSVIDEVTEVVAIETLSGRYNAENMLTHNCLPKDTDALRLFAHNNRVPTPLLEGTVAMNTLAKDTYEYKDIEGNWPNLSVVPQ